VRRSLKEYVTSPAWSNSAEPIWKK